VVSVDGGVSSRCYDIDTFTVFAIEKPNLGTDICLWQPNQQVLNAGVIESGLVYLWNDNSTQSSLTVTQSGTYSVSVYHPTINSSLKCSDDIVVNIIDKDDYIRSIKIQVDGEPLEGEKDSLGDRNICSHQRLKIFGPEAPTGHSYNYSWFKSGSPVANTPYYIFNEKSPGNYEIRLDIANGCSEKIKVTTEHCDVVPPNVITPNGDQWNEKFVIKGLENFPDSKLMIYNRWGKKVYQSENYQNDWDGENQADGVYFWILKVNDGDGTEHQGTLTILRK
jgi:gliding motility-associated-like protein